MIYLYKKVGDLSGRHGNLQPNNGVIVNRYNDTGITLFGKVQIHSTYITEMEALY